MEYLSDDENDEWSVKITACVYFRLSLDCNGFT